MRHNPSRAEIHEHAYLVASGELDTTETMRVLAIALVQKLDRNEAYDRARG